MRKVLQHLLLSRVSSSGFSARALTSLLQRLSRSLRCSNWRKTSKIGSSLSLILLNHQQARGKRSQSSSLLCMLLLLLLLGGTAAYLQPTARISPRAVQHAAYQAKEEWATAPPLPPPQPARLIRQWPRCLAPMSPSGSSRQQPAAAQQQRQAARERRREATRLALTERGTSRMAT